MAATQPHETVCLAGTPRAVGAAFGAINRADIRADMRRFYRVLRSEEHVSVREFLRQGRAYVRLVERYAPHWLPEAEGLAQAAGVDPERYILYQGGKYRGINRPECFTWWSAPACNAERTAIFHKNRDNRPRPQCAYVKAVRAARAPVHRFMAEGDTMDMGAMFGVNACGLAVAADTGWPDPNPRTRGMMNTDLMRLLFERCGDTGEALAFLRAIHADRAYAGGAIQTNWMMADRFGKAVRVYQSHDRLEIARPSRGLLVMRDKDPRGVLARRTLERHRGRITAQLSNRLSRQTPVLAASNISAFTATLPAAHPHLFTWAWFAVHHAGKTLYVPLYMGVDATPRALADGTLFRLSDSHPHTEALFDAALRKGADLEAFENDLDADRALMESAARRALADDGEAACRRILTDGCLRLANRVAMLLRLLA